MNLSIRPLWLCLGVTKYPENQLGDLDGNPSDSL
jgi:hypothetical protein